MSTASRWNSSSRGAALLVAGLLLAAPPAARALHFVDEGSACYACHSLNDRTSDPDSSAMAQIARTLLIMKSFNGGTTPARFGCTYCHSNPANRVMREALTHFGTKASKHPVGRNFVTGEETNGEYFSTIGSTAGDELDCVDCHDPVLLAPDAAEGSYVDHAPPDDPLRAGNPLMLRRVTAPRQYDEFCRLCHGARAEPLRGHDLRLRSHADAAAAPIRESDGTELRTTAAGGPAQCTACHDTHSSGKVLLLNDGHEGDLAVVSTDCTTLCHYAGDAGESYTRRGHGRELSTYRYRGRDVDFGPGSNYVTMNMACTACHQSLDTSDTSAGRKRHVERPTGGSVQDRYRARFNLNLPVQGWDEGSVFGNPLVGICYSCHAVVPPHRSDAGPAAGCLDCHDEHAEKSGRDNLFMIPVVAKANGSYAAAARERQRIVPMFYAESRLDPEEGTPREDGLDFFRSRDTAGICDNAACHPATTPLSTFMDSGDHPVDEQDPGSDCGACHRHTGVGAGSWRAAPPAEEER